MVPLKLVGGISNLPVPNFKRGAFLLLPFSLCFLPSRDPRVTQQFTRSRPTPWVNNQHPPKIPGQHPNLRLPQRERLRLVALKVAFPYILLQGKEVFRRQVF